MEIIVIAPEGWSFTEIKTEGTRRFCFECGGEMWREGWVGSDYFDCPECGSGEAHYTRHNWTPPQG